MKKIFTAVLMVALGASTMPQPMLATNGDVVQVQLAADRRTPVDTGIPDTLDAFFVSTDVDIQNLFTTNVRLREDFVNKHTDLNTELIRFSASQTALRASDRLKQQAQSLVDTIKNREQEWKRAESTSVAELVSKSTTYFAYARNLVKDASEMPDAVQWEDHLREISTRLDRQEREVKNYLENTLGKSARTEGSNVPAQDAEQNPPSQVPVENNESTVTNDRTEKNVSPDLPGAIGLFFRGISQSIQLLFSVDATKDATLRLKFAEDNLQLVERMVQLTANQRSVDQATQLAERARTFVTTVNERQEKWSKGDPDALNSLLAQANSYFTQAENVLEELNLMSENEEWRTTLTRIYDDISKENDKTKQFLINTLGRTVGAEDELGDESVILENDKDDDGIEDKDEIILGLSTTDFDTDGDGLSDKQELEIFGTDPTKADTDGDGHRDGLEILKGFNPVGSGSFSTTTLKSDGFVFVKTKMNLPTLSPTTLNLLKNASEAKKLQLLKLPTIPTIQPPINR